jgi:hypothetical protein
MQSLCCVNLYTATTIKRNAQNEQLACPHGIFSGLPYSWIALNLFAVRDISFSHLDKVGIFNEPMKLEIGTFGFRVLEDVLMELTKNPFGTVLEYGEN